MVIIIAQLVKYLNRAGTPRGERGTPRTGVTLLTNPKKEGIGIAPIPPG
jgi:hypothetical protein